MFNISNRISRKPPAIVYTGVNAKSALGTLKNTFIIKNDGSLWVCGGVESSYGVMGSGSTENNIVKKIFTRIGTDNNWKSLCQTGSGNATAILAIKTNGELWGWGNNSGWYLNQNSSTMSNSQVPIKISNDTDWESVHVSSDSTFAIKTNKTLWLCGYNRTTGTYITLTQIYTDVQKVSTGNSFILVINSAGSMYHFGANSYYSRGDGTNTFTAGFNPGPTGPWKEVSANASFCSGIKTDGSLWIWGLNSNLAVNGSDGGGNIPIPYRIGTEYGSWDKVFVGEGYLIAINASGETYCLGEPRMTSFSINVPNKLSLTNVKSLVTDGNTSVAVSEDSNAYGWGNNTGGAVGAGNLKVIYLPYKFTTSNDIKQIKTYASSYTIMKNDGSIWINRTNQTMFLNQVVANPSTLTQVVGFGNNWKKFELGYTNFALLHQDGTLWFTGGSPITTAGATLLKLSDDVYKDISMTTHVLALREDGSLWSWGSNSNGQLGLGNAVDKTIPTRVGTDNDWVKARAGWQWSAALKSDGTLWVWGSNGFGQLGDGSNAVSLVPKKFNNDTDWMDFTINNHILAVKSNGELWGCGYNIYSQLGNGLTTNINTPIRIGVESDWSYDKPMSAGTYSSLVSKNNGDVYGWGNDNNTGSSGVIDLRLFTYPTLTKLENFPTNIVNMNSGRNHLLFTNSSGIVFGWGDNGNYQLGDNTTNHSRTIKSLVSI